MAAGQLQKVTPRHNHVSKRTSVFGPLVQFVRPVAPTIGGDYVDAAAYQSLRLTPMVSLMAGASIEGPET